MKLGDLLGTEEQPVPDLDITGLTADSRQVRDGFLFFALKGAKDEGGIYIGDAIKNGAVVIVTDHSFEATTGDVPVIKLKDAHRALALVAARFFGNQPEIVAAVTGTSGKTSVVSFLRQIWTETGFSAASIGTIGVIAPERNDYGSLTTPDPVALQRVLKELADAGVTHAALEASSHGIDQKRLDGVQLTAAAFTNLGRDHMDYHPTVENYFLAKMRLFDTLLPKHAPAIIYADDKFSQATIDHVTTAGRQVLTVGQKGTFIKIRRIERERSVQHMECIFDDVVYEVTLPVAGDFQVANSIVAAGLAIVTGVPAPAVFRAVSRLKEAPGRLELVDTLPNGALVYVDYAHKPDALENVLNSVRPFAKGKVIVVFGCGGDRDKGKRPLMGEIANRLADIVIVTDDNPRSEVPSEIRKEIFTSAPKAIEIADRREAIHKAINMLQEGDTLIIAGKGHEKGQIIGKEILPFSDHAEALSAIEALKS